MREAAALLFSRVVVITLLVAGFIALIASRLRQRLRISPDQASTAPILWLVALTADARLHRRLRNLAAQSRGVATGARRSAGRARPSHGRVLARDIERELVEIDERLVASTELDFDGQRRVVHALRDDADRATALLDRVRRLVDVEGSVGGGNATPNAFDELEARLSRLEAARDAHLVIDTDGRDAAVAAIGPTQGAITTTAIDPDVA